MEADATPSPPSKIPLIPYEELELKRAAARKKPMGVWVWLLLFGVWLVFFLPAIVSDRLLCVTLIGGMTTKTKMTYSTTRFSLRQYKNLHICMQESWTNYWTHCQSFVTTNIFATMKFCDVSQVDRFQLKILRYHWYHQIKVSRPLSNNRSASHVVHFTASTS